MATKKSLKSRLQKAAFSSAVSTHSHSPAKKHHVRDKSSPFGPSSTTTQQRAIASKKVMFAIFVKNDEPNATEGETTFSAGQQSTIEGESNEKYDT